MMASSAWTAVASIVVTLLLAGVGYLIKGMLATGKLTQTVVELSEKTDKTAKAVEAMRASMLTPADLENAVLRLKLEVLRGSLTTSRDTDKA